jgi:hypothetical protein
MPHEAILEDGIHVMSNSFMDDLSWPKTCILKGLVEKSSISTAVTPEEIRDELFDIMLTRPHCTDFPESSLIQTGPFDRDDFEELGNIFVRKENGGHDPLLS